MIAVYCARRELDVDRSRARAPRCRRCRRSSTPATARAAIVVVGGIVVVTSATLEGAERRVCIGDFPEVPDAHPGSSGLGVRRNAASAAVATSSADVAVGLRSTSEPARTRQMPNMHSTIDKQQVEADAEDPRRVVDAQRLEPDAPERVHRDVQARTPARASSREAAFDEHDGAEHEQAPQRLVEERRMKGRVLREAGADGARRRSRAPTATSSAGRTAPG